MTISLGYSDLEIIGSTILPAANDLPRRLSPIYRRRGTDEIYLLLEEESAAPPRLAREEARTIDDMVRGGEAIRFDEPIAARPDHWLLQLEPNHPPEYLLAAAVPHRLEQAARRALVAVASAVRRNEPERAIDEAWYARRADPSDPLPALILEKLLRGREPAAYLQVLKEDLREFPQSSVAGARRRISTDGELASLGDLLNPPLRYLEGYRNNPSFFSQVQALPSTSS